MEKFKNVQFNKLHDSIYDIFGIDASDDQLKLLLKIVFGTEDIPSLNDDIIDSICIKYIGMKSPTYGSPENFKNSFYSAVDKKTNDLSNDLEYINRVPDEKD